MTKDVAADLERLICDLADIGDSPDVDARRKAKRLYTEMRLKYPVSVQDAVEPKAPLPEQLFKGTNGSLYRVWGDVSDCSSEAEDEPRMVIYSYAGDTEPKFARESSNFRMFFKPVESSENREGKS